MVDAVRELLPSIKARAPKGAELTLDFDQSVFVRGAIGSVLREAVISSMLVSLMILFFLGSWRTMVIVCTSIPLAIFSAIIGLFLTGQTINMMTLGGLALAIGMLVDDATVEVENIHRNRLTGKPLTVAILDGAHQIAVPALAATLTICIVFFPVVLLDGAGALPVHAARARGRVRDARVVPAVAHAGAGAGAPVAGRAATRASRRFNRWRDRQFERAARRSPRRCWALCIARRRLFLAGVLVFSVASLLLVSRRHRLLPVGRRGADAAARPRADRARASRTPRRSSPPSRPSIRRIIPADELDMINDMIGVPIFYNLAFVPTDNVGEQDAEMLVALKHEAPPTRRSTMARIRDELGGEVSRTCRRTSMPADIVSQVLNFGVSAPIDVQIEGRDPDAIFGIARDAAPRRSRKVPGTADVAHQAGVRLPGPAAGRRSPAGRAAGTRQRDVANSLLTSLSSSQLSQPVLLAQPAEQRQLHRGGADAARPDGQRRRPSGDGGDARGRPRRGERHGRREREPATSGTSTLGPPATTAPYLGGIARLAPTQDRASINHYTVQPVVDVQAVGRTAAISAASPATSRRSSTP